MAFSALHDCHHWESWLRVNTQTSLVEKLQPVLFQAAAEADGPEAIRSTIVRNKPSAALINVPIL